MFGCCGRHKDFAGARQVGRQTNSRSDANTHPEHVTGSQRGVDIAGTAI